MLLVDLADQIVQHFADPVGDVIDGAGAGRLHIVGGMADRGLRLRVGDEFGIRHRREHDLRALLGAFGIAVRRQPRGRLDEAGEHRGFRQRDVLRRLAEIALRCGLDAIGAGAEIDAVQIELEDFVLGMLALQPQRELDFLQFALEGALLGQEQILGELLRQRRAALRDAAVQDVGHRRARDADGIDAVMRIEAAVLDGDERFRQIRRQVLQRDIAAGHFAARRQHAAVEADDLDGRRALRDFQRLDRRQMRADPDHDADDRDRRPQAEHHAPVEQPPEAKPSARFGAPLGAALGSRAACARAADRRLHRRPCAWARISSACVRRQRERGPPATGAGWRARRRVRIAAPCGRRSFSVPTPYANACTGPRGTLAFGV